MKHILFAAALLVATPALAALPTPPKPPVNGPSPPPKPPVVHPAPKPNLAAQLAQARKQLAFAQAAIRVLSQHLTACNNEEIGAEVRLSVRRPPTP